jgi:hypothetical protein
MEISFLTRSRAFLQTDERDLYIGLMIKPKYGYMVRTDELSSAVYQWLDRLGKLCIDFVSSYIAPAIWLLFSLLAIGNLVLK